MSTRASGESHSFTEAPEYGPRQRLALASAVLRDHSQPDSDEPSCRLCHAMADLIDISLSRLLKSDNLRSGSAGYALGTDAGSGNSGAIAATEDIL